MYVSGLPLYSLLYPLVKAFFNLQYVAIADFVREVYVTIQIIQPVSMM